MDNQQNQPQPNQMSKTTTCFILIVIIIALGVCGYFLLSRGQKMTLRQALLDKSTQKFLSIVYQDPAPIIKLMFIGKPIRLTGYQINNKWIDPNSLKIRHDGLLTFVERIQEPRVTEKDNLVLFNPYKNIVVKKIDVTFPEIYQTKYNLAPSAYYFINRDTGIIRTVEIESFSEGTITLPSTVTSAQFTPDLKFVLFTKDETKNMPGTNLYTMDISSGTVIPFTSNESNYLSLKLQPYYSPEWSGEQHEEGNLTCSTVSVNSHQASSLGSWTHSYYSPDKNLLAYDTCELGIVLLDLKQHRVWILEREERPYLIGWTDNQHILARVPNPAGDNRVISIDIHSSQETRIVPENFYWDYDWEVSPNSSKLVYTAASIEFANFQSYNQLSRPQNYQLTEDVYLVDLHNKTREQLLANSPINVGIGYVAKWSRDNNYIILYGYNPPSGKDVCRIYTVSTKTWQTLEPCSDGVWVNS